MEKNKDTENFAKACELLHLGHGHLTPTPVETLNRLFRKHLAGHQKDITKDPPYLSHDNVQTTIEQWSTEALRKLMPRENSRPPRYDGDPVVIVRYLGRNCLIDGGSRIHTWFVAGDRGEHAAYILTVYEQSELDN